MKITLRILSLLLCLLMLLPLSACGTPSLDEVKGRFTELIEASYEINDIFFGAGP